VRAAVKPYTQRGDAQLAAPSMIERSLREKHSLNEFFCAQTPEKQAYYEKKQGLFSKKRHNIWWKQVKFVSLHRN